MSDAPTALGPAGAALWREVTAAPARLGPLERVLLVEACRIVDRLEKLDELIRGTGDTWAILAAELEDRSEVAVVIDAPLSEARHQAGRLTSVLAELRQRTAAAGAPPATNTAQPPAPGGSSGEVPAGVASIIGRARRPATG